MTDREMIEQHCQRAGLTIQGWEEHPDEGLVAKLGRYTVVSNDYEDDGLYEGDDGELAASVVGAEQYHNRRVWIGFTAEGTDAGLEVHDLAVLDPEVL